jgi:hypothetical protein
VVVALRKMILPSRCPRGKARLKFESTPKRAGRVYLQRNLNKHLFLQRLGIPFLPFSESAAL